jgi:hypothetical protein
MTLAIAASLPGLLLCVIGWWIGRFYHLKFGENPHSWVLPVGGLMGMVGTLLPLCGVPKEISVALLILGALAVAGGAFWLWYLLMGPRQR